MAESKRPKIEIVPYQPRWAEEFRSIGGRLRAALGDSALRIDHIGSTAVPGLAAKDIVDIQITVDELDPDGPLIAAMEYAGYECRPQFCEDHRPPGDTRPEAQWRKRYFREPKGAREVHIHVRAHGAANQRYALLFRDYLRANPPAMVTYEQIKVALARQHPDDADAYYDIKDPVCDLIIMSAEAWAAATDWRPGPSDA